MKKGIFFVEDEISFGEGSGIIFYRKFLTETGRGKESLYVELYESVYISIIWRGFYLFLPMDRNFYNGYVCFINLKINNNNNNNNGWR